MSANNVTQASVSKPPEAKWTVMVFMGAATFDGSEPLLEAADADLAEMASVGSNPDLSLNIFVQVHGIGRPRWGRVTTETNGVGSLRDVPAGQEEPAGGQALMNFIGRSLYEARFRQNNDPIPHHTMLVLWGHAYDFAIGREKELDGTIEALDFKALTEVLEKLQAGFGDSGSKLDILGFDACDAATVEIACQLQRFAKYLVGSQIGVPIPGWPYDRILKRLREPKGTVMVPVEFGSYAVRRFCESYNAVTDAVSLTLLDLDRAEELSLFGDFLAAALARAIQDPDSRDRIAYLFSQSQTAENKPYVDVADLCLNLVRGSDDSLVIEAATALGDFLISPRPPLVNQSHLGTGRPFVVEHGRNAGQAARLNGISIYAPHVAPGRNFSAVRTRYENFTFAKNTSWSAVVHNLAAAS